MKCNLAQSVFVGCLQTVASENTSNEAVNDHQPELPPAIPSRPEHTKSKVQ